MSLLPIKYSDVPGKSPSLLLIGELAANITDGNLYYGSKNGVRLFSFSGSASTNALTTASVSLNTITFTKGDSSTFQITVDTGSGSPGSGTVTSVKLTAGNGITLGGAGPNPITTTGDITITNDKPDQTVVLNSGSGISITSAYPTFTITNDKPDQTVVFTSGSGIIITGTYPNFDISSTGGGTFPFSGSAVITGSLLVSGSGISITGSLNAPNITGSLFGTSSWAINAITSSYPIAATGSTIYSTSPQSITTFNSATTVDNIFLGKLAGSNATSAQTSNFIGSQAGQNATSAGGSNFIGSQAGSAATNAGSSNFIGVNAGASAEQSNNSNFIGYYAGSNAKYANLSNFIGNNAGYNAASASYSNLIGFLVGANYSTYGIGPNNIIIGTNITLADNTRDSINIGGILFGTGSYSSDSGNPFSGSTGGRIGINVVSPRYNLDVSGSGNFTSGLTVTGSLLSANITGSLQGTASYVSGSVFVSTNPALSASFAVSASRAVSSSFATTASYVTGSIFTSTNAALSASYALSASSTVTASFLTTTGSGIVDFRIGNNGQEIPGIIIEDTNDVPNATILLKNTFDGFDGRLYLNRNGIQFSNYDAQLSNFLFPQYGAESSIYFPNATGKYITVGVNGNYANTSGSITLTTIPTASYVTSSNIYGPNGANSILSSSYALTASYAVNSNNPIVVTGSTLYSLTPFSTTPDPGSANNSIFLGDSAGRAATNAEYSNFVGANAGSGSINAAQSNFIGKDAGSLALYAGNSNFIGSGAGVEATFAGNSNFIGTVAGGFATNATDSNFIGLNAGEYATNASSSNFIGYLAGAISINADHSNFLGSFAGYSASNASNSNFLGYNTGKNATSASYSTLIGYNVGTQPYGVASIKSNNIIIGTNITLPPNTQDSINLGGVIFSTGSYSTITGEPFSGSAGGRVGINVVSPTRNFEVSGTVAFTNLTDSNTANKAILIDGNGQLFTTASSAIGGGTGTGFPFSGSAVITGSLLVSGSGITVTGSIRATSFTGSLFGTASYITGSIFTSINPALSSSYALSASFANIAYKVSGGTQNYIARWTDDTTLSVGSIQDDNTTVTITKKLSHGNKATASGVFSHAEGDRTLAISNFSHAEGLQATASAVHSHAEGYQTLTKGDYSHAEGNLTLASGSYSHAEGVFTIASGSNSHAEGQLSVSIGAASHAEGYQTTASGDYSHTEGDRTSTTVLALYSHAEGTKTTASGIYSHAEGYQTEARGFGSHAEGDRTIAIGFHSHAEGSQTISSGSWSHTAGQSTIASGSFQFVIGQYNKRGNNTSYFVIGNGGADDDNSRKDLLRAEATSIQITGSLCMSGSIIPNVNGTQTSSFSLGAANAAWKALYVATKSIHFMDGDGNEVANISVEKRGNTSFINTGDVISYDQTSGNYAGIVAEAATGLVLLGDYNRILANPISLTMDPNSAALYTEGSSSGASGLQLNLGNGARPVVSLGDFTGAGNSTSLILNDVSKTITTSGSFIISGSLDVSKGITGSLQGTATTASYVLQAVSASFATTASYAANISSYNVTQSFSNSSTWTFNHNLGYKSVIVQAYDSSDAQIIPQNIVLTNANTATITFPTNETGYAVATVGGTLALATSSFAQNAVTASYVNTLNQTVSIVGSLNTTSNITASIISATDNGNGTNFKVGDDIWLGDINTADTLGLKGQQNGTRAYIKFGSGSSNPVLGSGGTNTLELTGSFALASGSVTITTGSITMPNRPAFSVYGSGTTNNLTTTQNGDGTLNSNNYTVIYSQGSGFDSSTGIFTAPVAGLYQVTLIGRNSGYSSGISQLAVFKNNSNAAGNVLMIEWASSSTMNHAGGSKIFKLAVNDTLRLKVTAGQINFDGNDNWSVAYIG